MSQRWWCVSFLVCAAAVARADTGPWADGVPEEVQAQANALFAEGNELFAHQDHMHALAKYQAAIALWDHPMIRYNMAVTLIRLERIVEAADALDRALRFGDAPFTHELHLQALDYQHLLAGRVGTITASCTKPNAHVLLDGAQWFACPATQSRRVLAGEHAVVAEAPGFLTLSRHVVLAGAATEHIALDLVPLDAVHAELVYPVARWIPWGTAGAGAAIGVAGLGVWFSARNQMDRFKSQYTAECPRGCDASLSTDPALRELGDGARFKGRVGVAMMIGGTTVSVAGVVWALIFDRPRRVMPMVEVAPTAGGIAATAQWGF